MGLTFASKDDNYKVVLRGYSQSLFESRRMYYDSSESSIKIPITDFELDEYV